MATRAEEERARAERRGPHKPKQDRSHVRGVTRRAEQEAARYSSGHYAGGVTAERNVKLDRAAKATVDLEDSGNGRPSRKSTRKGAHRAKTDDPLRRRAVRRDQSPESRADKRS